MASTPSPGVDLPSTPPAPKYGPCIDDWEPYPRRQSTRLAQQSKAAARRSPSPINTNTRQSKVGKSVPKPTTTSSVPSGMLPSPRKTPRKATAKGKEPAHIESVSRDIFRSSKAKIPKKISGTTLESFTAEEIHEDFAIHNDSRDRIPKKDEGSVFYNPPESTKQKKRPDKQVKIPGEGSRNVEDAAGRDDGMLITFRGRTFYRHFAKPGNSDSEEPDELAVDDEGNPLERPLSAKQIQPKLLWPTPSIERETTAAKEEDDEEATTDVEDMHTAESDSDPSTPSPTSRKIKTPTAPRFGARALSPPTTQRTTRSENKLGTSPSQPALNYKKWGAVAKSHRSTVTPAKRQGEPLPRDRVKRVRDP